MDVSKKVQAATAASPVAALVVMVLGWVGVDMSVEEALAIVTALTPLVTFAAGWVKKELVDDA